jgi:hypothetical protein
MMNQHLDLLIGKRFLQKLRRSSSLHIAKTERLDYVSSASMAKRVSNMVNMELQLLNTDIVAKH